MEENQRKPTKRSKWTYVLIAFLLIETLALIDLLTTEDLGQAEEIKTLIAERLNSQEGLQYIQGYHSWRVGPYYRIKLVFFEHQQKQVVADVTKWLGLSPRITCLSIQLEGGCQ